MYEPISYQGGEVETLALDPIMDAPTALHCGDCGETLAVDRCLNPDCLTAGGRASVAGAFAPRAWTLGGRVD